MTIIFDGIAFGMLLFLISVGLSVTLGLMNFVNLAHGVFAMVGGYVDELNTQLNRWETIKKWELLDHDLTVESGELTPSMKVKRNVVSTRELFN